MEHWDAIDLTLQARSPAFRAWVTNHGTGQCGVGTKMKEWKFWDTSNCPCCNQPNETTTHFPFRTNIEIQAEYDKQIEAFSEWMMASDTDPDIMHYFNTALQLKALPTTNLSESV
jgi:hypothetical protein